MRPISTGSPLRGCLPVIAPALIALASSVSYGQKPDLLLTPIIVTTTDDPSREKLKTIEAHPKCQFNAQSGYHNANACLVQVWRDNPISPQAFVVPRNVKVFIELLNVRGNENITFTPTNTRNAPPDVGAAALKNFIPSLQSFVAAQLTTKDTGVQKQAHDDMALVSPVGTTLAEDLQTRQSEIADQVRSSLQIVQGASTAMTCLSNYQALPPVPQARTPITPGMKPTLENCQPYRFPDSGKVSCSPANTIKSRDEFDKARFQMSCIATQASQTALPQFDLTNLDAAVKSYYQTCLAQPTNMGAESDAERKKCEAASDRLTSQEASIDKTVTDIQTAQDAVLQSQQTLDYWTSQPERIVYMVTSQNHVNVSVAIAGTDVVSKVSTPIVTVVVNTTANKLVTSAGIGFSNLKYHTFTAAPAVTKTDTVPSVIAPVALLSYRLPYLGAFGTMNKCPGGCSFLLSAGVGANLTTKAADFDVGPSFQIGGVLITPAAHFGRDDRLSNGNYLGQTFPNGPPSSLPTTNVWVTKYAVIVSYSISIP